MEQVVGTPARARIAVGAGIGNALWYGIMSLALAGVVTVVFPPLGILCFLATPIVMIRALGTKRGACPRCDEPLQFVGKTHAKCPRCTAKVFVKRNGELGIS